MHTITKVTRSEIRTRFAAAMSEMYKKEIPLYSRLIEVVGSVNQDYLKAHPDIEGELGKLDRITQERHGAIRLGTPDDMHTMAQLFSVMGMHPVGYYDLTMCNLPVHSTCFRPISPKALATNPFRIFTSLLRIDLLSDKVRSRAETVLQKRDIFSPRVRELIRISKAANGLNKELATEFINESLETFRWHNQAVVSKEFYEELLNINGLVGDIIGFKAPHINHLTPRVLDIDELYRRMVEEEAIKMTPTVQGPPPRKANILLRQTSFRALEEKVEFPANHSSSPQEGTHRARFGEIEQRGIALTQKGSMLYDKLLDKVGNKAKQSDPHYQEVLEYEFKAFPDGYDVLRKKELGFFTYVVNEGQQSSSEKMPYDLEKLIAKDVVRAIPITYEDFLPVSAAGIFKSNLDEKSGLVRSGNDDEKTSREHLSQVVGIDILDPQYVYAKQQAQSILHCYEKLDIQPPQSVLKKLNKQIEAGPKNI